MQSARATPEPGSAPVTPGAASALSPDRWIGRALRTLMPSAVRMIGAGFQFLSTVMVARALGDGPSAAFFFWSSVLMTSGPIASFGLEQVALRDVPRRERDDPGSVGGFVADLRGVALAISVLLGLVWTAYALARQSAPEGPRLWHFLPLVAQGAIALALVNGESLKALSKPTLGTVYGHVLPTGLFCAFVATGTYLAPQLGSPGVLALYTASFVVGAALARYAPGGAFRARFLSWPGPSELRRLLAEGLPICCVSLFGALSFIVPLAICEQTRPAAEIAHLTAAFRISLLFVVISVAIHSVFAPALSRSAEESAPLRPVMRVYGKAIAIALLTLALPLAVGMALPGPIMSIFGADFAEGAGHLRLLLLLQLLSLIMGPVPYLLLMTGHSRFLAKLGVLKLVISVGLSALLVPGIGPTGMIAAMGVAFLGEGVVGVAYAVAKMRALERRKEVSP